MSEQRSDEMGIGQAKFVTLTEIQHQSGVAVSALPDWLLLDRDQTDFVDYDIFASIYNNGKLALLASWLPEFVRRHVNRLSRWSVNDQRLGRTRSRANAVLHAVEGEHR
jgi:hypothetical protein